MTATAPPATGPASLGAVDRADPPAAGGRVASVDVLRGLTIFLMVFVNGMGANAPAFLHHIQPPRADGMTLADVVFPMFLFIVGVSIPLAVERSRAAGVARWAELRHILGRTASLLVMGVVELNHDEVTTVRPELWGLLAFTALILAWCSVPREPGWRRRIFIGLKVIGVVGLVALLAVYRRDPVPMHILGYGRVENWSWFRSGWWGILGLIGWAYLTVAVLYLLVGRRREWLMGALALLMTMHLAGRDGGFFDRVEGKVWLQPARPALAALERVVDGLGSYVSLGDALGSLAAVTMAGCLLGSILRRDSLVQAPRDRITWGLVFALGLGIAALMTDTFEGINKIGATPTWCFLAAAVATLAWVILYAVIDVAGFRAWAIVFRPAGANPLLAYFLHPITVWAVGLAGFGGTILGYAESADPRVVVGGAAGMALFVCILAGLLGRLGLRVKL